MKAEHKLDSLVRAAWLYYVAGKNQSEIAVILGVSRPAVQRMIASANEEGIISIDIKHPVAICLEYEKMLQEKFNLSLCRIVPYEKNSGSDHKTLVSYGASQVISQYIKQDEPLTIGLGSGLTLKLSINNLENINKSQHQCIALISQMNSDGLCNYYDDVPMLFADKIKAGYYQLPAPLYSTNEQSHKVWCSTDLYQQMALKASNADVIFIGIGSIGESSPIVSNGFINDKESQALQKKGAVGELLGRFFDHQGQVIKHPINTRVTSHDLRQSNKAAIIGIASGSEKQTAILASLRGKWINGLITDEQTARWLLTQ
ncbi:MAG: sugar-binding transcriptional regulator [Gammaproteobacteria bacterium]|nr:sugar-binding transcriptional regulator [Gammaproteobacteria bacterium]